MDYEVTVLGSRRERFEVGYTTIDDAQTFAILVRLEPLNIPKAAYPSGKVVVYDDGVSSLQKVRGIVRPNEACAPRNHSFRNKCHR